ncbi:MAG: CdaR family protein [Candidatus Eiseniibacteriota bacterium]
MWGRIRDYIFRNFGLKVASLLLALLFYAHVVTDQQRESQIAVPVLLTGLSDTLAVVGNPPARVGFKVRGKWKDLIRLGLTTHFLSIDLANASPGRFQRTISVEDVRERAIPAELTRSLDVTEVVEPRMVDLTIEAKRGKTVPVAARVVGRPAPDVEMDGRPRVEPDTVHVTGPASVVQALDTLFTLPVDITGEREKIQRQVPLDLGPNALAADPRRCLVTIHFARAAAESTRQHP